MNLNKKSDTKKQHPSLKIKETFIIIAVIQKLLHIL